MNDNRPLDRVAAKHQPEAIFARPLDIVTETRFTRGEKIATLERWRLSIVEQLRASAEGMRTHGVSPGLVRALEEIEEAKRKLV